MKTLTLLKQETRNSRLMSLYRCYCGVEKWIRADRATTRFRTCNCPTPAYDKPTKICTRCRKDLPVDEYFRDKRTGNPRPRCKNCVNEENKFWHERNRERSRAAARANNRKRHPLKRFGLERAEYERLLAGFGSTCGICSNPETQRHKKTLSLDHCHKTGVIRGALCSRCNTLLGWA